MFIQIQAAMGLAGASGSGATGGGPSMYAAMDPQAMGTRIPAAADGAAKRGGGGEEGGGAGEPDSKRSRAQEGGTGYGA